MQRALYLLICALAVCAIVALWLTDVARAQPDVWKQQGWAKTDFSKSAITFSEVLSGGPPKDGIPSIDAPKFEAVANNKTLKDRSPVISLVVGTDARAYPLRILIWHEIVNDTIGSTPVAVTYCPLCNAAIVFDRRHQGRVLDFGTTGKLRNSDLIMYDRQTESWWQQFSGEAIVGTLLGGQLKILPARLENFAAFRKRHPNGRVLVPTNPGLRAYGSNPYVGYDSAARPFLFNGTLPKGINPMARVVVVGKRTSPHAVSVKLLRERGTMRIDDLVLSWRAGQASALDTSTIDKGRDVGTVSVVRVGAGGKRSDVAYDVTFAFVFHAFHPNRTIRTK